MSFLYVEKGDNGKLPKKTSCRAAGYDLYSAVDVTIGHGNSQLISTDIKIACPPGTYGRIASRSGLALKDGLDVAAGVIDPDYRGEVNILIRNTSNKDFVVKKGDRIAQLILEKYEHCEVIQVATLDTTCRGKSGFGSSGINDA